MRRQSTRLLAAFAAAGAASLSGDLQAWPVQAQSVFTSPDREFSVAFAAPPKVDSHPPRSEDAAAYWIYSVDDGGGAFLVRVDQYPAGIPVPAPNPRTYELLLGAHAMESSSRLVSIASIAIGAFPAVEGVFTDPAGVTEKRRVVMAGHRLYQIAYTHAERAGVAAAGDAFLASFRIPGR